MTSEWKRQVSVVHVNSSDGRGGASRIAADLFHACLARGMDAWLAVGQKSTNSPRVVVLEHEKFRNPWARFWIKGCRRFGLRPAIARILGRPLSTLRTLRGEEDFDFPGTQHLLRTAWESGKLKAESRNSKTEGGEQRSVGGEGTAETLKAEMLKAGQGQVGKPDVLHLHNLHGSFFDLRVLPALSRQVPTVVTLHDEWMLTGHCAASMECARWQTGCGSCPDLKRSPSIRRDATASNWKRKKDIYEKSRLHIVTPSRALMDKVAKSMLAKAAVSLNVIPHGIDLSVFKAGDREEARQILGLPKSAKILLFSAQGTLENPYKDFRTLRNALGIIANERTVENLLLIALGKEAPPERIGQVELRFVPYQNDPKMVARYCQASDIYVHASKAESWGLAVTEAMACGLPVVASAVGGIPDQVEEGVTGFLVEPGNPEELAERVKRLVFSRELRMELSLAASETARKKFALSRMVGDYIELYKLVLAQELPTAFVE